MESSSSLIPWNSTTPIIKQPASQQKLQSIELSYPIPPPVFRPLQSISVALITVSRLVVVVGKRFPLHCTCTYSVQSFSQSPSEGRRSEMRWPLVAVSFCMCFPFAFLHIHLLHPVQRRGEERERDPLITTARPLVNWLEGLAGGWTKQQLRRWRRTRRPVSQAAVVVSEAAAAAEE